MSFPTIEDYQSRLEAQPIIQQGGVSVTHSPSCIEQPEDILVSVITVVYNAETTLEKTIKSVISQSYPYLEYIIIDGGSDDQTLSIIQSYEDTISYWMSQPDEGIYDAMNKGITLAKGQIIGILNAGDIYLPNTLEKIVKIYQNYPHSIITGYCKVPAENSQYWMIEKDDPHKIPFRMIPHPSLFVSQTIYQEYGLFDIQFKIAGDYELINRFFSQKIPFISTNSILTKMGERGQSRNYYLSELESLKVRLRYQLIPPWLAIAYSLRSLTSITIHLLLSQFGLWTFVEAYRNGRTC